VIGYFTDSSSVVNKDESTPIVILIPGLTSDSSAPVSYFKLVLFICVAKLYFSAVL
jgi:hypothetical protein